MLANVCNLTPKKPIVDRLMSPIGYPLVIVVTLAVEAPAQGADLTGKPLRALTEGESVRLALARPAVQSLTEARIALARSGITEASRWSNPEIEYSREQVDRQSGDSTENFYWLSQRFELSGQRGLRTQAAEHRVRAATLGTEADRANIVADTRADFYRVLHQQERLGDQSGVDHGAARRDTQAAAAAGPPGAARRGRGLDGSHERHRSGHPQASIRR